ncbi:MAG: glucokinase [Anaerolineae bacterium]|jgi:glucokinase
MLLAVDIGGTNTRLALYPLDAEEAEAKATATYASRDKAGPREVIEEFLDRSGLSATRAVLGVAGPVVGGRSPVTNLPWIVDEAELRHDLGLESVTLVNDLEALAAALPYLRPHDVVTISPGSPQAEGAIAILAPGTGLGEAFLVWGGSGYSARPSEGGHTDFAPRNEGEIGLLQYMGDRFSRVSYEHVCSGTAIPYVFDFLRRSGYAVPDRLEGELAEGNDKTPIIIDAALDDDRPCQICQATMRTFASMLGAEAGNLALKTLSTGGLYLGGGIPRRILPFLTDGPFLRAMRDKGHHAGLVTNIPVRVITCPEATLRGAAAIGLREFGAVPA